MDASLFAVGAMLAQNPASKYDQLIVYAFTLQNKTKQNYTTTERKTLEWFMLYIISDIFCWEFFLKMYTTWLWYT
jgi:hypothetical protein